jgi:chromosome segregation ATPase
MSDPHTNDESTRDTDPSELAPNHEEPSQMSDRAILVALLEEVRDGAKRLAAVEARLNGFDARLCKLEREVCELARRAHDADERLGKLLALTTTLAEELLEDRQRVVELETWRTKHERGNTHCVTCPNSAEESTVGVGGGG